MRTDLQVLRDAVCLFEVTDDALCLRGAVQDFLLIASLSKNEQARRAASSFRLVLQDVWNVATIIDRLDWMRSRALVEGDAALRWMRYASVDIQSVHVEIRASMDYLACAARQFFSKPGPSRIVFVRCSIGCTSIRTESPVRSKRSSYSNMSGLTSFDVCAICWFTEAARLSFSVAPSLGFSFRYAWDGRMCSAFTQR